MCSQKRFMQMTKSGIGLGGKRKTAELLHIMDCLQWKSVCGCFLHRFINLLQYTECKSKQRAIPNDSFVRPNYYLSVARYGNGRR